MFTVDIWNWCRAKNVWLSAVFIKGVDNVEADYLSRNFDERTEWTLKKSCSCRFLHYGLGLALIYLLLG